MSVMSCRLRGSLCAGCSVNDESAVQSGGSHIVVPAVLPSQWRVVNSKVVLRRQVTAGDLGLIGHSVCTGSRRYISLSRSHCGSIGLPALSKRIGPCRSGSASRSRLGRSSLLPGISLPQRTYPDGSSDTSHADASRSGNGSDGSSMSYEVLPIPNPGDVTEAFRHATPSPIGMGEAETSQVISGEVSSVSVRHESFEIGAYKDSLGDPVN